MFNYKPLLKKMVDADMSKKELKEKLNFTNDVITKISKNEDLSMKFLNKLCNFFECSLDGIVEHVPDDEITENVQQEFSYVPLVNMMEEKGLGTEYLKENVGLSDYVITRIKKGKKISPKNLNTISEHFECSINDIAKKLD